MALDDVILSEEQESVTDTGDTVIMLSSELIAEVMEEYFNKTMFKKKVKVVDLQATATGYAFSLAFVQARLNTEQLRVQQVEQYASNGIHKRDRKGKFTKKGTYNE